jgi:hypothetical protein
MTTASLASTNRVKHSKIRETTFNVIPTNPAFLTQRVTSSGLNSSPKYQATNEIRYDRQVVDAVLVGEAAAGDLGKELSFQTADADFEEALQGTWSLKPNITNSASATPISALSATTATVASGGAAFLAQMICVLQNFPTAANNNKSAVVSSSSASTVVFPAGTFSAETAAIPLGAYLQAVGVQGISGDITATASGLGSTALNWTTLGLVPGEWVKVGGALTAAQFATAANIGFARVSAIAAGALTFDILPAGWATDSGAGKTISVFFGDVLRNGATMRTSTIERQYADQAVPTYEYLSGLAADKLSITLDAQKMATYSVSYMGASTISQTSRIAGATDIAAPVTDVFNTSSNLYGAIEGGSPLLGPDFALSLTLSFNNNLREQIALSSLAPVGIGNGEFDVSLSLGYYFGDNVIYNKLLNNTLTSFAFRLQDTSGENPSKATYLFDVPTMRYLTGAPTVPGKNQDVMMNMTAQGLLSPTYGYTAHIGRYWYTE